MPIRNFVVFEGGDGSGTSTQLALVRNRFASEPLLPRFYGSCEPTGGPIGRLIRLALKEEIVLLPETLARLFAADRTEHLYAPDGILSRAAQGGLVISDRYVLSSLVYQGITCGTDLPRELNASFPAPEVLFFFDVDPEIACRRIENRPVKDIYEYADFQSQVRERYKALLPWYAAAGVRIEIIDAALPPEETAEIVWKELQKLPILKPS
jgi:dTMP kinase